MVDVLESYQVTIPPDIRRALKIKPGDRIEFATKDNGEVLLRNQPEARDPEQAWFWTPEWQAGEQEADADKAAGRVTSFGSGEEFISWLETH